MLEPPVPSPGKAGLAPWGLWYREGGKEKDLRPHTLWVMEREEKGKPSHGLLKREKGSAR